MRRLPSRYATVYSRMLSLPKRGATLIEYVLLIAMAVGLMLLLNTVLDGAITDLLGKVRDAISVGTG